MRQLIYKIWRAVPAKVFFVLETGISVGTVAFPKKVKAWAGWAVTPENIRWIGLIGLCVGLAYWLILALLKPDKSQDAASPGVVADHGSVAAGRDIVDDNRRGMFGANYGTQVYHEKPAPDFRMEEGPWYPDTGHDGKTKHFPARLLNGDGVETIRVVATGKGLRGWGYSGITYGNTEIDRGCDGEKAWLELRWTNTIQALALFGEANAELEKVEWTWR